MHGCGDGVGMVAAVRTVLLNVYDDDLVDPESWNVEVQARSAGSRPAAQLSLVGSPF